MWETPKILVSTSITTSETLQYYDLGKTCIVVVSFSVACDHIKCC